MIDSITIEPLDIYAESLWFHDFCGNLYSVRFLPDQSVFYMDTRLYNKLYGQSAAPLRFDRIMNNADFRSFSRHLCSMSQGDLISGRITLLPNIQDNKIVYLLNHGIVYGKAVISGVFYDISMDESLRAQLVSMDNLIMLGQLSAGILHDVGNHIMTVGAMASVIKELSQDETIRHYADDIMHCMDACGELTSNSKGIAKSSVESYMRVNVWSLMLRIANMLKGTFKDKYTISIKTQSEYYYVLGDEYLLQNAILNILLNARDAMPDGGAITISITGREDLLRISVRDNGIGMDDSVKQQIFDPFFTTKSNMGTGIGLTRCKSTIESHNGTIDVISAPGRGSEFIINLPLLR